MSKTSKGQFITFKSVSDCMDAEHKARLDKAELEVAVRSNADLLWHFVKGLAEACDGKPFDSTAFLEKFIRPFVERLVRDNLVISSAERYFWEVSNKDVA